MNIRELVAQALEQHGAITHVDDAGVDHIVESLAKLQPVINIYVNAPIPPEREGTEKILATLTGISKQLAGAAKTEGALQVDINELITKANSTLATVQANTSLDQSIAALVDHNTQTIADLQTALNAAGTDPAKLQQLSDAMDAIQAAETANGKIVADKITANTPAAAPAAGGAPAAGA